MSARDAILAAFDELFDAAATKLNVTVTPQDRDEARARFASASTRRSRSPAASRWPSCRVPCSTR